MDGGHNPYFNRWFSAIQIIDEKTRFQTNVTILILIDGFLQLVDGLMVGVCLKLSQSLF